MHGLAAPIKGRTPGTADPATGGRHAAWCKGWIARPHLVIWRVENHLRRQPIEGALERVVHGGSIQPRHARQAQIPQLGIGLVAARQQDIGRLDLRTGQMQDYGMSTCVHDLTGMGW